MSAFFPLFWTLGWALVSQVLLFRYGIFWGGYGLLAIHLYGLLKICLLYTSPSPRDLSASRMPSSA